MTTPNHPAWLAAALNYLPQWMEFQMERHEQVGCALAIVVGQKLVSEMAFGRADLRSAKRLTPRHRFRIASHSKSFTAAGVMRLRELGRLGLDDAIGAYVPGLHKKLAQARIGELLSHGAGVTRDGADSGQFSDRRPFLSRDELRAALAERPPLAAGVQLKYSNHGYGLLGLLIESVTGQQYAEWIGQQVLKPLDLAEVAPDMPDVPRRAPLATGHSAEFPFGQRLIVPGDNACHALAPAAGFVATAADTARFFAQLAPSAKRSLLKPASRREMLRRRWRDPVGTLESHYGLGLLMSGPGPQEWFGHTGSLQGFVSRTSHFPASDVTISVLCNANDGLSYAWVDGILSLLQAFQHRGAPGRRLADWGGRWWNNWGATDLVPMGNAVLCVQPWMTKPFDDSNPEITVKGKDSGIFTRASAYLSPGEPVRRVRDAQGKVVELWMGGSRNLPREAMMAEAKARYEPAERRVKKR